MDDDELLDIASKLESASDNDAAHSQLSTGKPWLWLTGNRDALLRFAVAFIRAAAAPISDDDCRAEPTILEHRQINDAKTDYILGAAQRIDEFPENPDVIANRKRSAWQNDRGALLGCGIVGFIVLSILLSGIAFWWHVITGTPLR
jgi:hypothetical protein